MFSTFYPAAPGETAFSLLATACIGTADNRVHHMLATAFRRCSPMIYTIPCRLQILCELTNNSYGNPNDILQEHSLYGYFCAGMSPVLQVRLHSQLTESVNSRICAPRLNIFYECHNRYGLDCPECLIDLRNSFGRRASLCQICLPFITCCPTHKCRLEVADQCSASELLYSCESTNGPSLNSARYAELSKILLENAAQTNYRADLYRLLIDKGYATSHGRVRLSRLCNDFTAFFSAGFDDNRLTAMIQDTTIASMVIRSLGREDRAIHPVYLTLIHWFLTEIDKVKSPPLDKSEGQNISKPSSPEHFVDPTEIHRKRREWLAHVNESTVETRTKLRLMAAGLWTWLYRHDRCWLEEHQTEKKKPNGKKGSARIPGFLLNSLVLHRPINSKAENLPPRLESAYQSRLDFGLSDYSFKRLCDQLPGIGYSAQTPGAKEIWIARRIAWAIGDLLRCGETLNEAKIAVRARIRIETMRKHFAKLSQSNSKNHPINFKSK